MSKTGKLKKIHNIFEIPDEISSNIPKITSMGFNKLIIENYKSILEYQDIFVRISTSIGIININGLNLNMGEMTKDDIVVCGNIDSIEFEGKED